MGYINFENNAQPAINDTNLNLMQIELMKLVFPVGSTYITQENINPSTILNFGTWERLKGRVCLGLDENDVDLNTIGKTGGEKEHTLTIEEMPSHTHGIAVKNNSATGLYETKATNATGETGDAVTGATGGNQPHNNMQPYEVVGYMWIRRS